MKSLLSFLALQVAVSLCTDTILRNDPFVIGQNDLVSALYNMINANVSFETASRGISIIFRNKIILNYLEDHRTITDIGMNEALHDIEIILKPDFAAILEMVMNVNNRQQIPWLVGVMSCLSDVSANQQNQCQNLSEFGKGLHCDDNGNLIGMVQSRLNLTGMIHLESLPPTVRSLDLSFNDLKTLNLEGLKGKSLERLNVEHNSRCHINTECFHSSDLNIKELQLSSNQIFPWIMDLNEKRQRIRHWLCRLSHNRPLNCLELVIMDGISIHPTTDTTPFYIKILRILDGVTNEVVIHNDIWDSCRVECCRRGRGGPRYRFNLSGLGLAGDIRLRPFPSSVRKLDLSNNNFSTILVHGDGQNCLEELNVQHNNNLKINLSEIEQSSLFRPICRLSISSNQLQIPGILDWMEILEFVREWLNKSEMTRIVVDDVPLRKVRSRPRIQSF